MCACQSNPALTQSQSCGTRSNSGRRRRGERRGRARGVGARRGSPPRRASRARRAASRRRGACARQTARRGRYFKDFMADGGPKFLAGNLSKRYEQGHCGQARYAVDSAAFQRDNSKNSSYVAGWPLARADFVRDETIAVHAPSIRKAITQEFGPSALQVLHVAASHWACLEKVDIIRMGGEECAIPASRARAKSTLIASLRLGPLQTRTSTPTCAKTCHHELCSGASGVARVHATTHTHTRTRDTRTHALTHPFLSPSPSPSPSP